MMQITIKRNQNGIFAQAATIFVGGKAEHNVTIWCAPGKYAKKYEGKSDGEIAEIARAHFCKVTAVQPVNDRDGVWAAVAIIASS